MTLSKILVLTGLASAGISDGRLPMLRRLVDHELCEHNLGELTVDNGVVSCNGSVCELKTCIRGYHKLKTTKGQSKKVKCVSNKAGLKWNKNLLQCRTCSEMTPLADNNDFESKFSMSRVNSSIKPASDWRSVRLNAKIGKRSSRQTGKRWQISCASAWPPRMTINVIGERAQRCMIWAIRTTLTSGTAPIRHHGPPPKVSR